MFLSRLLHNPRLLITGSTGQLGPEIAAHFRRKFGNDNVICSSTTLMPLGKKTFQHHFCYLDVCDISQFQRIVVDYRIDWIIHFAAVLSALGEQNPALATQVNVRGVENALQVAYKHGLRLFIPSSVAAFGPTTPRIQTPDITTQRPTSIYGIAKVYAELLGEWYHKHRGVDFRSLRYPGIVSWKQQPGGGTTDWACQAYFDAVRLGRYEDCFISEDTKMPMIYIDDFIEHTSKFLETDSEKLSLRTYNVNSMVFSPKELEQSIQKKIPNFVIRYTRDRRQKIADSWPISMDSSRAKQDWQFENKFDIDSMTQSMLQNLKPR